MSELSKSYCKLIGVKIVETVYLMWLYLLKSAIYIYFNLNDLSNLLIDYTVYFVPQTTNSYLQDHRIDYHSHLVYVHLSA